MVGLGCSFRRLLIGEAGIEQVSFPLFNGTVKKAEASSSASYTYIDKAQSHLFYPDPLVLFLFDKPIEPLRFEAAECFAGVIGTAVASIIDPVDRSSRDVYLFNP